MIHALITGKLTTDPVERTSKAGRLFVTLTIAAPNGTDGDISASVICFSESTGRQLLALGKGDAVSIVGKVTPKVFTDRQGETRAGLDVVAEMALSAYALKQKRDKAVTVQVNGASGNPRAFRAAAMAQRIGDDLGDDLPF